MCRIPPDFGCSAAGAAVETASEDSASSAVAANARTLDISIASQELFKHVFFGSSGRFGRDDSHQGMARQPAKAIGRIGNLDEGLSPVRPLSRASRRPVLLRQRCE